MRPAVERHPGANCSGLGRGEQQAICAEIIEPDSVPSEGIEHRAKTAMRQQLSWQKMVALETRIVADTARTIDRAKGDEDRGPNATLCLHLFAPDPDSFLAGQRLHNQTAAIRSSDPVNRREPSCQDQMVDDPDAKPRRCHLVDP